MMSIVRYICSVELFKLIQPESLLLMGNISEAIENQQWKYLTISSYSGLFLKYKQDNLGYKILYEPNSYA